MKYPPPLVIQELHIHATILECAENSPHLSKFNSFYCESAFLLAELAYKHPLFVRASPNDY